MIILENLPPFKEKNIVHINRYVKFINSRNNLPLVKEKGYEIHHIIPVSLGGNNSQSNLIKLTYREHLIAHLILWKAYKGPMSKAYFFMAKKASSRIYKSLKEEFSTLNSGKNNARYGKSPHQYLTKEQKLELIERLRAAWKAKSKEEKAVLTKKRLKTLEERSEEEKNITRKKKSKSSSGEKNGFYNKKHNKETREKISRASKNRKKTDEELEFLRNSNSGKGNPMYGKTLYSVWDSRYGEKEANLRLSNMKRKMSESHKGKTIGDSNGMYGKIPQNALTIFWEEKEKIFNSLKELSKESEISAYLIRKIIYSNHKIQGFSFKLLTKEQIEIYNKHCQVVGLKNNPYCEQILADVKQRLED